MPVTATKSIFCAACQAETAHTCTLDKNQEIVATCGCGRAIKFPMPEEPAHLDEHLSKHAAANVGQVTVEMAQAEQEVHDARFKKIMGIA